MKVISEGPFFAYHCEEPDRATWQSPNKKRGDCFAPLAMTLRGFIRFQEMEFKSDIIGISRFARNDIWWYRTLPVLVIERKDVRFRLRPQGTGCASEVSAPTLSDFKICKGEPAARPYR